MSASILPLFRRPQPRDWTTQELAEFYRVESALVQSGISVETERGVSDEGEPWFVFCRSDNGDVLIHFARIDGVYVAVSAAFEGITRGSDFTQLVQGMLREHPLVHAPNRAEARGRIFVHPAASLVALVATIFFVLSDGDAMAAISGDAAEGTDQQPTSTGAAARHNAAFGRDSEANAGGAAEKHMAAAVTAAAIAITLSQSSLITSESEAGASASTANGRDGLSAALGGDMSNKLGTGLEHVSAENRNGPSDGALQVDPSGTEMASNGASNVKFVSELVANIAAIETLIQTIDARHPTADIEASQANSAAATHPNEVVPGQIDSWLVSDEARLALVAWQGEDAAVEETAVRNEPATTGSAAAPVETVVTPAAVPAQIDAVATLSSQLGYKLEVTTLDKADLSGSSPFDDVFDLMAEDDFSFEDLIENGRPGDAQPVQSGTSFGTYDDQAGEIVKQFLADHTTHTIVWTDDGSELVLFSEDDAPDAPHEVMGFYLWTHKDGSKTIVFGYFDPQGDDDFQPYVDGGHVDALQATVSVASASTTLGGVNLAGFIEAKVDLLIG